MAPMMNMVNANECKFHVFKKGAPKPYPIMMHQVTEPAAFAPSSTATSARS